MNVAVLGAGNGGFAIAADLALAGHRVRLWSRSASALGPLAGEPALTLVAEGRQGSARLERATTEIAVAVAGAEVVIVPLPATGHADLAERLAPHVNEGQTILLTPGTLGSYAMARDRGRTASGRGGRERSSAAPRPPGCRRPPRGRRTRGARDRAPRPRSRTGVRA